MTILYRLAALSLISSLACAVVAQAGEPLPGGSSSGSDAATGTPTIPADSSKAIADDVISPRASKASFDKATPAVRVALCGVEADAGNTGLDAGLIDFNVPDSARAAGRSSDDQQDVGRNLRDYHSAVFLGVTLGYHF